MARIRSNRGNLYPTNKPKRVGHKDFHYSHVCSGCSKVILKQESQMAIPDYIDGAFIGTKYYHWRCVPEMGLEWFIDGEDLFIDEDFLEKYRKKEGMKWGFCGRPYDGLVLGFGINVQIFSTKDCPILEER